MLRVLGVEGVEGVEFRAFRGGDSRVWGFWELGVFRVLGGCGF